MGWHGVHMTDDGRPSEPVPPPDARPPDEHPAGGTRRAVLWSAAEARGVPLRAILATIAAVIMFYLAGKIVYRLRYIILPTVGAGCIALLLNPLVVGCGRWACRRGPAGPLVT